MNAASPSRWQLTRDAAGLHAAGELTVEDAGAIWRELRRSVDDEGGPLTVDLSKASVVDGAVMALFVDLRAELAAKGRDLAIEGANERVALLADLYGADDAKPEPPKKRKAESLLGQVGRVTIESVEEAMGVLGFVGELVLTSGRLLRHPRRGHWKDIPHLVERAGAEAVFIVVLINFLVGFVMAYQSANQLKTFGANVYVADLVGISVTRELAPLMTAIIICGRSGAGFTAEIGSMKVSEEIDALRTIGLVPFGWLVVPRVIALVVAAPILTLVADFVGIAGGALVGVTSLDLTLSGYISETRKAVVPHDIETGLVKSAIFGLAIALIACQKGFVTSGGAEGVGRRTTSTVVTSLFALVVLDALFTVVFRFFDL